MDNDTTRQGVLFKGLSRKSVVVGFDQDHASSDGGAILLKACDERLGLSAALVSCLHDRRQPNKVRHTLLEQFRQRLFGIACGYEDANDASRLGEDPIFKLLVDRDPLSGATLASQPTLSRFERSVGARELLRLSEALAKRVIERHRRRKRRVQRITIDLDPTVDPTHGGQQLTLFNRFYDTWCYLPLAGFLTFDDEPEQYLFCYALRDGHAAAKQGCLGILRRLFCRACAGPFPRPRSGSAWTRGLVARSCTSFSTLSVWSMSFACQRTRSFNTMQNRCSSQSVTQWWQAKALHPATVKYATKREVGIEHDGSSSRQTLLAHLAKKRKTTHALSSPTSADGRNLFMSASTVPAAMLKIASRNSRMACRLIARVAPAFMPISSGH
jgi:hypothetical protein